MMEERRRELVERDAALMEQLAAERGSRPMWELHYDRGGNKGTVGEGGDRMAGSPGGPLPLLGGAPPRGEGLAA